MTLNFHEHSEETIHEENNLPRLQKEVSSSSNGQSESFGPLQEKVNKSIKCLRESEKVRNKVVVPNVEVLKESIKFDRRLSFESQSHIKSSNETIPIVETRNSRFKIRLSGESSKGLLVHEENETHEKVAERIILGNEPNLEEKKESKNCEEMIDLDGRLHDELIERKSGCNSTESKFICENVKEKDKQFDLESEILDLSEDEQEDRERDAYVERDVAYMIRIHLAPIDGPSLEEPSRTDSFQVNIEYGCIGKEKYAACVFEEREQRTEDYEEIRKECEKIEEKEENGMEEMKSVLIEKCVEKESGLKSFEDGTEGELRHCESLLVSKVEEKEEILKELNIKRSNLAHTGSIYNESISPSDICHKDEQGESIDNNKVLISEQVEKVRLLSESLEPCHRIFKSHPFLDKALKKRNKILPKNRSEEKEGMGLVKETRNKEKIKEVELIERSKEKIKKRNINEYKLKQIISEAKNEVLYAKN